MIPTQLALLQNLTTPILGVMGVGGIYDKRVLANAHRYRRLLTTTPNAPSRSRRARG
jgi:hypothetical protein